MSHTPDPTGGEATLNSLSAQGSQTQGAVFQIKSKLEGDISSKIADIHKDSTKAPITDWLEAAGLGGVAAGVEKIKEGEGFKVVAPYFASAFVGLAVPAIGLLLLTNFTNMQRWIQSKILNGVSTATGGRVARNQILAMNDDGTFPRLQDRDHVRGREDGAGGLRSLANPPDASDLAGLREALADLNPKVRDFNTAIRKTPKASALTKTGEGMTSVKTAVNGLDHEKVTSLARALGKLTGAVKHHNPKKLPDPHKVERLNTAMTSADPAKIKQMATATGKLASAQRHFDPRKIPKSSSLASAARSAERLAKAGNDSAEAFRRLRAAADSLSSAV
ncbi:hypothetical protein ABZ990_26650 [Streptomyces sp. NPDC046203]|uniref:hypothetical protein n=1 Tax=Streptomyces sp. NPDC046203 TaxID=3154602 RepID=UPI0033F9DF98